MAPAISISHSRITFQLCSSPSTRKPDGSGYEFVSPYPLRFYSGASTHLVPSPRLQVE
ncbi:hypothetical protein BT69DRAFT_1277118 [Atractiella rhizophila]|nr:hypothetical protein BT69DRAFT_1282021 [Atractiella rhizophila]KAH8928395.1 hypothetical protein BT69DRAFT_1277118 [Atractiella rhizophila]